MSSPVATSPSEAALDALIHRLAPVMPEPEILANWPVLEQILAMKIELCPDKRGLLPNLNARCSLADSINADYVRALRVAYPDLPVVAYVNTSAEVKAESDICCTSANAVEAARRLGVPAPHPGAGPSRGGLCHAQNRHRRGEQRRGVRSPRPSSRVRRSRNSARRMSSNAPISSDRRPR
jgi:hypothetical protein